MFRKLKNVFYIGAALFLTSVATHAQNQPPQDLPLPLIEAHGEIIHHPAHAYELATNLLAPLENSGNTNAIAYAKAVQAQALNRLGRSDEAYNLVINLLDQDALANTIPHVQAELFFAMGQAQSMQGSLAEAFMSFQKAHDLSLIHI